MFGVAGGGPQYDTNNATLFRHDPKTKTTDVLGEIVSDDGVGAVRIHCMTLGPDGRLFAGETGMAGIKAGDVGHNAYLFTIEL